MARPPTECGGGGKATKGSVTARGAWLMSLLPLLLLPPLLLLLPPLLLLLQH